MTIQEMNRLRKRWSSFYSKSDDTRWYVYVYRYPQGELNAGKPFYIGKGTGNRVFNHLDLELKSDMKEEQKVKVIQNLKARDISPDIELLADCLSEAEALRLESIAIDSIGLENLTNIVAGQNSTRCPIGLSEKVLEKAVINHDMIAFKINQSFPANFPNSFYDSGDKEHQQKLYEYTTLLWGLDLQVLQENNIKFYCALYKGIILDVFELDNTKPWMRIREAVRKGIIIPDKEGYRIKGFNYRIISSSEFDESRVFLFGHLAHEIREPYLGKKVIGIEHPGPFRYLHKIDQAPQN